LNRYYPPILSFALGAVTGVRQMAGPAVFSRIAGVGMCPALQSSPFRLFASRKTANVLAVAAAGESVADKTPIVLTRTSPPALIGRIVTGAVVGGAVATALESSTAACVGLGGFGAVVSTFGVTRLRRHATQELNVPNVVGGLVEDAAVLGAGYGLIQGSNTASAS